MFKVYAESDQGNGYVTNPNRNSLLFSKEEADTFIQNNSNAEVNFSVRKATEAEKMPKLLLDVVHDLSLKFKSGNNVPVTRATFSKEEWQELVKAIDRLDTAAKVFLNVPNEVHEKTLEDAVNSDKFICPSCSHIGGFDAFVLPTCVRCPECGHDCLNL